MKTIDLIQRTPEWLAWREEGISASDVATIMGLSPHKTPWRLWAEKTGLVRPQDMNINWLGQRGIAGEDPARVDYEDRHDTIVMPSCGESDEHPLIRASFDGLDDDGNPVELKVPHETTYLDVLDRAQASAAYALYWPQVQTQMYVADARKGVLVFHQGPGIHAEFVIERDDEWICRDMLPACLGFWDAIKKKREPPRDPDRDIFIPVGDALERWTEISGEYRNRLAEKAKLDGQLKTLKESMEGLQSKLTEMMGDFILAETAGLRVLRFSVSGLIDYRKGLSELAPDIDSVRLEAYRRAPSNRVKITAMQEDRATVPFLPDEVEATRRNAENQKGFYF